MPSSLYYKTNNPTVIQLWEEVNGFVLFHVKEKKGVWQKRKHETRNNKTFTRMSLGAKLPFIIHTKNSKYLYELLQNQLHYPLLPVLRKAFSDSELYYRIYIENRTQLVGREVVVVSTLCSDEELMDLYRISFELLELGISFVFCN